MWIDTDIKKLVTRLSPLELITIKTEADKELKQRYEQLFAGRMTGIGQSDIIGIGLSAKGYNVLKRGGVQLVRELCLLSGEDMMTFRNLNKKVVEEVHQRLDELFAESKEDVEKIHQILDGTFALQHQDSREAEMQGGNAPSPDDTVSADLSNGSFDAELSNLVRPLPTKTKDDLLHSFADSIDFVDSDAMLDMLALSDKELIAGTPLQEGEKESLLNGLEEWLSRC
jgi:hypothetical protein